MRARRTVYNSVATSCADTRHSTMVQRMDPSWVQYLWKVRERSAELSNRAEKEKDLRRYFFLQDLYSLRFDINLSIKMNNLVLSQRERITRFDNGNF